MYTRHFPFYKALFFVGSISFFLDKFWEVGAVITPATPMFWMRRSRL